MRRSAIAVVLLLVATACANRSVRTSEVVAPSRDDTYLLGIYPLVARGAIVDGDTVKVEGLDASLRLLAIDTEEKYRKSSDEGDAASDFAAYAKAKRGEGGPAKFGTPMGLEAKRWAQDFFDGHDTVRLEVEDPTRTRGYFRRYLVYVFVVKEGRWVNYNLEAVREGMTPYFVKYGRSSRFDAQFVAAQKEAQTKKLGVWGERIDHYPDYDERLEWWGRRADTLERFARNHHGDDSFIALGQADSLVRMRQNLGKVVTLFATIGDVSTSKQPYRVHLSHQFHHDVQIICFDDEELAKIDPERWRGDYVYVRGKVTQFRGRVQFKADHVERIWTE